MHLWWWAMGMGESVCRCVCVSSTTTTTMMPLPHHFYIYFISIRNVYIASRAYTHKHTHISHFVHISRECGVRAKGGSDGTNASEKKNTKNKNVIPTGWKRCLVIWRCWYTPIAHNAHKIVCVAPGAIMFPRGG